MVDVGRRVPGRQGLDGRSGAGRERDRDDDFSCDVHPLYIFALSVTISAVLPSSSFHFHLAAGPILREPRTRRDCASGGSW